MAELIFKVLTNACISFFYLTQEAGGICKAWECMGTLCDLHIHVYLIGDFSPQSLRKNILAPLWHDQK